MVIWSAKSLRARVALLVVEVGTGPAPPQPDRTAATGQPPGDPAGLSASPDQRRAGRLTRIDGRNVLRLSHNPATKQLYDQLVAALGA